jgi:hypothetical protein
MTRATQRGHGNVNDIDAASSNIIVTRIRITQAPADPRQRECTIRGRIAWQSRFGGPRTRRLGRPVQKRGACDRPPKRVLPKCTPVARTPGAPVRPRGNAHINFDDHLGNEPDPGHGARRKLHAPMISLENQVCAKAPLLRLGFCHVISVTYRYPRGLKAPSERATTSCCRVRRTAADGTGCVWS